MSAPLSPPNRVFTLFGLEGHPIVEMLQLHPDGALHAREDSRLKQWIKRDNALDFLDADHQQIMTFQAKSSLSGQDIYFGNEASSASEKKLVLIERPRSCSACDKHVKIDIGAIKETLKRVDDTVSLNARKTQRIGDKRRILFLIHNMASWDSLAEVHALLDKSYDFDVIVASIPRRFPGENSFAHEDKISHSLTALGIAHIRLPEGAAEENLRLIKRINPDGIFRQAPWDNDIPEAYSTAALAFTNIFYIPYYGFNLLERFTHDPGVPDFYADQEFHRACATVFCECDLTRTLMMQNSKRGGDHFVATGHPKLEHLVAMRSNPLWPISRVSNDEVPYRKLIWAPHHSVVGTWLAFGLFPTVYKDMLEWVTSDPSVQIVLKPHPALFTYLVSSGQVASNELNDFIEKWQSLPNATIVEGGDYGSLFAASDAMITDGISFLAEYMMFWEKPLIFLERPGHAPFNEIGRLIEHACYVSRNVEETRHLLTRLGSATFDAKTEQRRDVCATLLPREHGAAKRIVRYLRSFFSQPTSRHTQPSNYLLTQ